MQRILRLADRLEQHSSYQLAVVQGRPVRIRKEPLPDGQRRGRGRPRGTPNGVTNLFLSPDVIERLRAEIR